MFVSLLWKASSNEVCRPAFDGGSDSSQLFGVAESRSIQRKPLGFDCHHFAEAVEKTGATTVRRTAASTPRITAGLRTSSREKTGSSLVLQLDHMNFIKTFTEYLDSYTPLDTPNPSGELHHRLAQTSGRPSIVPLAPAAALRPLE